MRTELFKIFLVILNTGFLLGIFKLFSLREAVRDKRAMRRVSALIVILIFMLFTQHMLYAYVRHIEPNWIKIESLEIKSKNFPRELTQCKIIQISDLHIKKDGLRERTMVRKINGMRPDIIFITGDFLSHRKDLGSLMKVLSSLKARLGIYGVLGDIDFYAFRHGDIAELKEALGRIGVTILDNENVRIPLNEKMGVYVVGLTNELIDEDIIAKAYAAVEPTEPKILLVHYPTVIDSEDIHPENTDVVLSGDTHGGQIGLSILRRFSASVNEDDEKYLAGLFYVKGIPLYVNRGIGSQHKEIRFFCRPEITLVKFSSARGIKND